MEGAGSKAARYERRFPGTGVSDAQAAERMERLDLKEKVTNEGGRKASRFFSVPELPWKREENPT